MTKRVRRTGCRRGPAAGLTVVMCLLAASCSNGDGGDAGTGATGTTGAVATVDRSVATTPETTVDAGAVPSSGDRFDAVTVAAGPEVAPFDDIRLDGIADVEGVYVALDMGDGTWWPVPLLADDDGAFVPAPVAPADPLAGGEAGFVLTDGTSVGPRLTVDELVAGRHRR